MRIHEGATRANLYIFIYIHKARKKEKIRTYIYLHKHTRTHINIIANAFKRRAWILIRQPPINGTCHACETCVYVNCTSL